jgi:predicted  nucleic acid-binding Zn-ribbon protein
MKIHLDYLEGRIEDLENENTKLKSDKKNLSKKLSQVDDKIKQGSVEKDKEIEDLKAQKSKLQERLDQMDQKH